MATFYLFYLLPHFITVANIESRDPAQIVVTSGIVETIDLIAMSALSANDTVVVEDPGYDIVRRALNRNGLRSVASPVDGNGLDITKAVAKSPREKRFHSSKDCNRRSPSAVS